MDCNVYCGDCMEVLRRFPTAKADLIYLDPPFFTQRKQKLSTRDRSTEFSFDDRWNSISGYASFLAERLGELHRVLKPTGSIFFHCDKTASHVARLVLDDVFGMKRFQSEIIWSYRRWSNSARKLLPAHQTILFYSKEATFKFNVIRTSYSPTTNVDQILQRRSRDASNKSVYARDAEGNVVYGGSKRGVPLSDVWEIPFLNPKARERTGYPTQKPLLLLEQIIRLVTDEGDVVLDPFCGSGTTLVAAKLLARSTIGIDVSEEAVELTRRRLAAPVRTESHVFKKGVDSYKTASDQALALLNGIAHTPVQRSNGIDAFLEETYRGVPIPVRVQRPGETVAEAALALYKAAKTKQARRMIVVATEDTPSLLESSIPEAVQIIPSATLSISRFLQDLRDEGRSSGPYLYYENEGRDR